MTAYMKPKMTIDDQLAEQQIFAQESAGNGRGELAVKSANPQLKQLEDMRSGRAMDRRLMFGALGMKKKQMEHNMEMDKAYFGLQRDQMQLAESKFHFNLDQSRKAVTASRFQAAVSLAFAAPTFMQGLKRQRILDRALALYGTGEVENA